MTTVENVQRSDGVLNMSYRNSPNKEKLKVYFEKKGQQANQFNDLMNNSFKGSPRGADTQKERSFRMAPNAVTGNSRGVVDITAVLKYPERGQTVSPMTEHTRTEQ